MLRWLLALSAALGLPLPIENRAITGLGLPLNADAVDSARPSALPMNSAAAHTQPKCLEMKTCSFLMSRDGGYGLQ